MEKTESPTESRLQELRDRGIIPYSALTTYCAGCMAALLVIYFQSSSYVELWTNFKTLTQHNDAPSLLALVDSLMLKFLVCVSLPVIAASIGAVLIGLIQSKFLLLGRLPRFEIGRINPFMEGRLHDDKIGVLAELFFVALGLVLATVFYLLLSRDVLAFFNGRLESIVVGLGQLAGSMLGIVSLGLTLLAALSWLVVRIIFRMKHRMTHQEVQSEARE